MTAAATVQSSPRRQRVSQGCQTRRWFDRHSARSLTRERPDTAATLLTASRIDEAEVWARQPRLVARIHQGWAGRGARCRSKEAAR